mmetsp:Transcript_13574/g.31280  ORF Transcript_13574/g.31280 Transcript_13574/m.31280 type:complete len:327 (-) Transcript_13574:649-1629(-)
MGRHAVGQEAPLNGVAEHLEGVDLELSALSSLEDGPGLLDGLGAVLVNGLELAEHNLATQKVKRLDASGALPHCSNTHITDNLLLLVGLDVPVAAVDLDAKVGCLEAALSQETLENRCEEAHFTVDPLHGCGVAGKLCLHNLVVEQGALVDHGAATLSDDLLGQQHTAHVGVHNNRVRGALGVLGATEGTHRETLLGVPKCVLEGQLSCGRALDGSAETRGVDEGEHVVETLVLLANQKALRRFEVDLTGGRPVAAHLVLDAANVGTVHFTKGAVGVDLLLGHQKQGNSLSSRGCVGETSEHTVHNVVSEVVVTAGDEDLSSSDAV